MSAEAAGHHGSKTAIVAAAAANLGIAIAKAVGWMLTGSAAMLAEAVHSVADTTNQGLLLLGMKRAKQAPTKDHPYGYGREQYIWAAVVSLLLFSVGGLFALYEGFHKLGEEAGEDGGFIVAIVILSVAVVLEAGSLLTAIRESRPLLAGRGWWRFVNDSKSPELPVVLFEDTGAMLGLLLALVGVVMTHVSGNPAWDGAASMAIGVVLCVIAAILVVRVKKLLVGETASDADLAAIKKAAEATTGVRFVGAVRAIHLSGFELLVDVKVRFDPSLTADGVAEVTDEVERNVRAAVPSARLLFVESWREH